MKIYGHPASSAGRCYWLLEELGIKYERGQVDLRAGEHKQPWFLDINIYGKIPALVDGDLKLSESMAINQYLTEKFKPQFAGTQLEERAKVAQWNYWAISEYQRAMIELFIQMVFVPELKRDANIIEKSREKCLAYNHILDQSLMGRSYLINHEFTLADLNVASVAQINAAVGIDTSIYPNLHQWLNRILKRKSAIKLAELMKS